MPAVDFLRLAGHSRSGYISPGAHKEKLRKRNYRTAPPHHRSVAPIPYAELRAASAFSFLDGASLPEDLVQRAAELDLPAVALLDRNGVYGAPRFYQAARQAGIKAIVGAEVVLDDSLIWRASGYPARSARARVGAALTGYPRGSQK